MTARPIVALIAMLALAACARAPAPVASDAQPASPIAAECREQAQRSPDVRNQAREANIDNAMNTVRLREERAALVDNAFRDCLRRSGAPLPGGVERIRG